MNENPQFKHQRAKSILWLCSDSESHLLLAADYVKVARYDTENNPSLPENDKLKIALEHIKYTQSKIYGRICVLQKYEKIKYVEYALQYYEDALSENDILLKSIKKKSEKSTYDDLKNLIIHVTNNNFSEELTQKAINLMCLTDIEVKFANKME
ncbi:hypothetical protein MsAg5_09230 [Methanosarcinaceae archaeon Ag5]|uniref:Uncharacterized protein n=1 Tax=Methanolapillus africanus TaxID=3028297 RepID=A0AAE4MJJ9_9EURY|nr:hypothetical protein [Methanosarcinaceae archaeon Ag5]